MCTRERKGMNAEIARKLTKKRRKERRIQGSTSYSSPIPAMVGTSRQESMCTQHLPQRDCAFLCVPASVRTKIDEWMDG